MEFDRSFVKPLVKRVKGMAELKAQAAPDLLHRYICDLRGDQHALRALGPTPLQAVNHHRRANSPSLPRGCDREDQALGFLRGIQPQGAEASQIRSVYGD